MKKCIFYFLLIYCFNSCSEPDDRLVIKIADFEGDAKTSIEHVTNRFHTDLVDVLEETKIDAEVIRLHKEVSESDVEIEMQKSKKNNVLMIWGSFVDESSSLGDYLFGGIYYKFSSNNTAFDYVSLLNYDDKNEIQYKKAWSFFTAVLVSIEMKKYLEATSLCDSALSASGKYTAVLNTLSLNTLKGYSLSKLDRHEEAINCYKNCTELPNGKIEGYINIGVAFNLMNQLDSAEYYFKKATSLDADYYKPWYCLASLYAKKEDNSRLYLSVKELMRINKEKAQRLRYDKRFLKYKDDMYFNEFLK